MKKIIINFLFGLPLCTLAQTSVNVKSLDDLLSAINSTTEGSSKMIVMDGNIEGIKQNVTIPSGRKVTLDMGEHNLKFGANNSSIVVYGEFTLNGVKDKAKVTNTCTTTIGSGKSRIVVDTKEGGKTIIDGPSIGVQGADPTISNSGNLLIKYANVFNLGAGSCVYNASGATCIIQDAVMSTGSNQLEKALLYADGEGSTLYVLGGTYSATMLSNKYVVEYGGTYSNETNNYATKKYCTQESGVGGSKFHYIPYVSIDGIAVYDTESLVLEDKKDLSITNALEFKNVTYERTVSSQFGTICLPFAISSNSNAQLYKIVSSDEGTLTLEKTNELSANTPGIFKCPDPSSNNVVSFSTANYTLQPSETPTVSCTENLKMVGVYETTTLPRDGKTFYISGDKFWKTSEFDQAAPISPYRSYIVSSTESTARIFTLVEKDSFTGIAHSVGSIDGGEMFDLSGRKVNNNFKGLVICNGKKKVFKASL